MRPHTVAMTNTIFVVALLAASTCTAATKISYDEIPKHLGACGSLLEHRGFTVTTTDGKMHKGRRLEIYSDHLSITRGKFHEQLPKANVTRIEISQAGRFFHHVVASAQLIASVADPAYDAAITIIFGPPVLAYAAATTPLFLAADGIAFFIPPKVYEIVH